MESTFFDSKPINLSSNVFRFYQYCFLKNSLQQHNSGIMVEDGCFEFMFIKESNVKLQIRNENPISLPTCFSLGKLPMPYRFIYTNTLTLFTIKVQPWVSSFFFPNKDLIRNLAIMYNPEINRLHQSIFSSSSFKEMIGYVEDFFKHMDMPNLNEYNISRKICEKIYFNNGNIKIKELLNQFPYSRQSLNKLFINQTKNSIKEFAIYVRVREIIKYKILHPEKSLTSIALIFGYFDQSHFIKDIKRTAGVSPSKFLSKNNLFDEELKCTI
jgi:AraC-like DNA-binding protein